MKMAVRKTTVRSFFFATKTQGHEVDFLVLAELFFLL